MTQLTRSHTRMSVFRQGDVGTNWYAVLSGSLDMNVSETGDAKVSQLTSIAFSFTVHINLNLYYLEPEPRQFGRRHLLPPLVSVHDAGTTSLQFCATSTSFRSSQGSFSRSQYSFVEMYTWCRSWRQKPCMPVKMFDVLLACRLHHPDISICQEYRHRHQSREVFLLHSMSPEF